MSSWREPIIGLPCTETLVSRLEPYQNVKSVVKTTPLLLSRKRGRSL